MTYVIVFGIVILTGAVVYVLALLWDKTDQDRIYAGLAERYREIDESSLRQLSE